MNRTPILFLNVLVIAACGLVYELLAGTVASYVIGDSVTQFSLIIGLYLSALGVGAWLSRYLERDGHRVVTAEDGSYAIPNLKPGDYIVTAWAGYIFYVYADGRTELMLDTHLEKKNTADIGYDSVKKILFVPEFNGKRVAAYRLK